MAGESQPKAIYVRLDDALLARVDRFVDRLAEQQPGLNPSRSDAIRMLVHKGLDAFASEGEPR